MVIVEGAASVRVRRLSAGLYVNEYSGVLTLAALHRLFERVPDAMPDARAVLVRPRGAVLAFDGVIAIPPPPANEVVVCRPSGLTAVAVVVAPECYSRLVPSCASLIEFGLLSTCWVSAQHGQAVQWLTQCLGLNDRSVPASPPRMLV